MQDFEIIITGSHSAQRKISDMLGRAAIYSGWAGKGRACARVTEAEFADLKAAGFKVARRQQPKRFQWND